jgi:hypothetical protein
VRERSRPLYGLMGPDQGGTVFGVARNWLRILRCRIMGLTPTLWRQRPERWLSRSLKRHPLICFALVLFAGQCACAFAMELLIPKPSPLRGYVTSIFLPLGLSFVAAGLLLAFGEWKAAASRSQSDRRRGARRRMHPTSVRPLHGLGDFSFGWLLLRSRMYLTAAS